jgi:hypothetical protein
MENITVSPKEETLEEAAERILLGEDLDLSDYDKRHILKAMVNIAKWQSEQLFKDDAIQTLEKGLELLLKKQQTMYSEEEVLEFANWCRIQDNKHPNRVITIQQLFEQFKKK